MTDSARDPLPSSPTGGKSPAIDLAVAMGAFPGQPRGNPHVLDAAMTDPGRVIAGAATPFDRAVESPRTRTADQITQDDHCDFCHDAGVVSVVYTAAPFVTDAPTVGPASDPVQSRPVSFDEYWAACPSCADLVDRGDVRALAARSAAAARRRHGLGRGDLRVLRPALERLHRQFLAARTGERDEVPQRAAMPEPGRPWEGTFAYPRAVTACEQITRDCDHPWPAGAQPASAQISRSLGHALPRCHVVQIDPEQVDVLPVLTATEAAAFAREVRLPFDPLFLDVTDSTGRPVDVDVYEKAKQSTRHPDYDPSVKMHAALVSRLAPAGAFDPREGVGLSIATFGGRTIHLDRQKGVPAARAGHAYGRVGMTPDGRKTRATDSDFYGPSGIVHIGAPGSAPSGWEHVDRDAIAFTTSSLQLDGQSGEVGPYLLSIVGMDTVYSDWPVPTVIFPADSIGARHVSADDLDDRARVSIASLASSVAMMAVRALTVLYFLESRNVELVDAPVSRQVRRHAERRGHRLALTVRVRRSRRRATGDAVPAGGTRNYDHRFEREGHYNHVTRGPHVRCRACEGTGEGRATSLCGACGGAGVDPERVKPCQRIDETTGLRTCPRGCRREWVPPTVVGPDDKPLIPKVRKVVK